MKKLSILLAGVCLTAALYSAGTTYGQNKTNSAKQKEDTVTTNKYQGVTIKDKAKGKVTKQQVRELKKEHSGKDEGNIIIWAFPSRRTRSCWRSCGCRRWARSGPCRRTSR